MNEIRYKYLNAIQHEISGLDKKLESVIKIKGAPVIEIGAVINWVQSMQEFLHTEYNKLADEVIEDANEYNNIVIIENEYGDWYD